MTSSTSPSFSIREAIFSDVDQIISIAEKSKELNMIGFLTRNDVDYCINVATKAKFYVATDWKTHKVIGFIYGFVEVPSTACLMYICVENSRQNMGVGKTLVNDFVIAMKAFGVQKIYCLTTTERVSIFFDKVGLHYTGNLLGYMEMSH